MHIYDELVIVLTNDCDITQLSPDTCDSHGGNKSDCENRQSVVFSLRLHYCIICTILFTDIIKQKNGYMIVKRGGNEVAKIIYYLY